MTKDIRKEIAVELQPLDEGEVDKCVSDWLESPYDGKPGLAQIICSQFGGPKRDYQKEAKDGKITEYIRTTDAYDEIRSLVMVDEENNALFDNELAGQLVIKKFGGIVVNAIPISEILKKIGEMMSEVDKMNPKHYHYNSMTRTTLRRLKKWAEGKR